MSVSLSHGFILLMTGNGFDFMQAVALVSTAQAMVLLLYLIFSAMILLNGLISIVSVSV